MIQAVPSPANPTTEGALWHLILAAGAALLTYALLLAAPGFSFTLFEGTSSEITMDSRKFLAWAPGEWLPLARQFQDAGELPSFAEAGGGYQAAGQMSQVIEETLGSSVARNLGPASGAEAGLDSDVPIANASGGQGRGEDSPIRIDPSEYDGIDVEVEHPEHLSAFFAALTRTANEEAGALTRISHYGDSSIATDLITHTVRRRLQRRFGDGGHGFVLIARGTMPYGHRDMSHSASRTWDLRQLVANQDRAGLYGFGGVSYRGAGGATAEFGTDDRGPVGGQVSRFQLYYRQHENGGPVSIRVDGGEAQTLSTSGEERDRAHLVEVPDGPHSIEVRPSGGSVRLYGMVMERDGPGVVYDSLGMVGARARRLLNFDADHIRAQMELRSPNLLVLGFGGNEADDPMSRMPRYEGEFVRVIRRMRAGRRNMSCLVFGPLDQAARDSHGRIATIPTVPHIIEAQKRAAEREGCAFYDTYQAMGGEGAIHAWSRARPRLAMTDYRHATPAGYEVIGNMFYKALLKAFAENRAR